MAELLSAERISDNRAFEREWTALRECVSPWSDKERLRQYFPTVDWPRLLMLADKHGLVGQLAACLNDCDAAMPPEIVQDRKSTRLNSSHRCISYAVFCLKKKTYETPGQSRTVSASSRSRKLSFSLN